jgi:beta-lactamase class A
MRKSTVLRLVGGGLAIFFAGFFVGSYTPQSLSIGGLNGEAFEVRLGGKGLTNPLLECELGKDTIASRKQDFTPELSVFVDSLKKSQGVNDVSVYFRDLNNGPIVGINQNENFAPASLLKVPVLIAYLRWAEDKPEVLTEEIIYQAPVDVGYSQQFAPIAPLEVGRAYTAKELLEIMIKYSDNQALVLLFKRLPASYQGELYTLLGVDPKLITDPTARLTIRQYSIFLRVLFNASFLSRVHSEYALDLLTQTTFEDGVRAGVPLTIPVAHKFGERKTKDGLQQFHDCGVIYYPNHPYLLCVMTRGSDVQSLIESIANISEFVYKKIDTQYR